VPWARWSRRLRVAEAAGWVAALADDRL